MALLEEVSLGWGGGVVGFGVVALTAPAILPAVGTALRPVAKAIIKGYFALTDMVGTQTSAIRDDNTKVPKRTSSLKQSRMASKKRERARSRSRHHGKAKQS
jgi:hypothetical protein